MTTNLYKEIRRMERESKVRAFHRRLSALAQTGHVTVVCESPERAREILEQVRVLEETNV